MNGHKQLIKVKIDREVLDPDDPEMLQDLVVAAVNEAARKVEEAVQSKIGAHGRRPARPVSASPLVARPMSDPLARLIGELPRLPGIGPKTATRLAHHLLKIKLESARGLARGDPRGQGEALPLFARATASPRSIRARCCTDPQRDRSRICVVEEPFNIAADRAHRRVPRPLPRRWAARSRRSAASARTSLAIAGLLDRLDGVEEIILATNPNVEGEATALYLARVLRPRNVKVTRLAFGHADRRRHRVHR